MAENQDGQEKTEEPTQKKLQKAREEGQIARSREMNSFILTAGSALMFIFVGGQMLMGLAEVFRHSFVIPREHIFDETYMIRRLTHAFVEAFLAFMPIFVATVIMAIIASVLLGGFAFSTKAMAPKLSKLNHISGLKRILGTRALIELVKSFAKFTLILGIAGLVFSAAYQDFIGLGMQAFEAGLVQAGELLTWGFLAVSMGLLVVAFIDVPYQLWQHNKQLRMTKQEVKDEFKQTEGRPEVKQKIRQTQMQMSQRRQMENVPNADVVITNPTHYSVALKYDPNAGGAPVVVAKGVDEMALNIRKIAAAHGVEIFSAPPLARSLYHHVELDQAIPEDLYNAVAQVMAYVFRLREAAAGRQPSPDRPDPQVPDDLAVAPDE